MNSDLAANLLRSRLSRRRFRRACSQIAALIHVHFWRGSSRLGCLPTCAGFMRSTCLLVWRLRVRLTADHAGPCAPAGAPMGRAGFTATRVIRIASESQTGHGGGATGNIADSGTRCAIQHAASSATEATRRQAQPPASRRSADTSSWVADCVPGSRPIIDLFLYLGHVVDLHDQRKRFTNPVVHVDVVKIYIERPGRDPIPVV